MENDPYFNLCFTVLSEAEVAVRSDTLQRIWSKIPVNITRGIKVVGSTVCLCGSNRYIPRLKVRPCRHSDTEQQPTVLNHWGFAHQHLSLPKVLPAVSLALLAKLTQALLRSRFFKSIYPNGRTYSHWQDCVKYYTSAKAECLIISSLSAYGKPEVRQGWLDPNKQSSSYFYNTALVCRYFPFGFGIFFKTENIDVVQSSGNHHPCYGKKKLQLAGGGQLFLNDRHIILHEVTNLFKN